MTTEHNHEHAAATLNVARPLVEEQDMKFFFKEKTDELGNTTKKPTVILTVPVPTIDGLIEDLSDEKVTSFVMELVAEAIKKAVKSQVDDPDNPVTEQSQLDTSIITLKYLANQPAAERRGGGISKETWEAFGQDYLEIMPAITGKKVENIQNAVTIFLKKYQPVKTNKPVLKLLREQLALYTTSTKNLEEFSECVTFLDKKAEILLTADEAKLLENL
jgi:hypothetical protein